jgi:hypothetical protein
MTSPEMITRPRTLIDPIKNYIDNPKAQKTPMFAENIEKKAIFIVFAIDSAIAAFSGSQSCS